MFSSSVIPSSAPKVEKAYDTITTINCMQPINLWIIKQKYILKFRLLKFGKVQSLKSATKTRYKFL